MTLWLSNADVQSVLSMPLTVDTLDAAFKQLAAGRAAERNPSRTHTFLPQDEPNLYYMFKSIEGGVADPGVYAIRMSSDIVRHVEVNGQLRRQKLPLGPGGRYMGLVLLFDTRTGQLLSIMQDGFINMYCTGAAHGGLGARYLARKDSAELAMIGSGWQARGQLLAACYGRTIREARVYSPTQAHRETYADEMAEATGVAVRAVESAREAVRGADIVICATNTREPVYFGEWTEPGMLVISIVGCDRFENRREIDDETFRQADVVVAHSRHQAYYDQQPDLYDTLVVRQLFPWDQVRDLYDIVGGKIPGRQSDDERIVYKANTGIGVWYASVGAKIYELARAQGLGRELADDLFHEDMTP